MIEFAIKSEGKHQAILSAAHLTACASLGYLFCNSFLNYFKKFSCNNGLLPSAYDYYEQDGLVTGGEYGSGQGCWPYLFPVGYPLI